MKKVNCVCCGRVESPNLGCWDKWALALCKFESGASLVHPGDRVCDQCWDVDTSWPTTTDSTSTQESVAASQV